MPAPTHLLRLLGLCTLVSAGCVKQDTEILSRVGRKLADKAQTATSGLRDKLPFRITTGTAEPAPPMAIVPPPSLADQVQQRLATDKLLSATKFEVQVRGAEVELKGTADNDDQRRRAVELAETTQGVEKVIDSVAVRAEKTPEN